MPPRLYLFTGISFAGKSVLARRLAALLGVPRVDPDEVSHRLGLGLAGEFLSDAQWANIHPMAEEEACTHLRAGTSVVYDTTAFTRRERDHLRAMAARCGAASRLIFVDTPRDFAFQRWLANERTQERARVHPDDFAMVADLFEPPDSDEDDLRFTPEDDAANWIRQNVIPGIAAVLFDLDNTLVDRRATFQSWAQWFVRNELGLTESSKVDQTVAELIHLDRDGYTSRASFFEDVASRHPALKSDIPDLVNAFRQQFAAYLPPLAPGTVSLLDVLDAAGLPWGVVTNGTAQSQRAKMRWSGLESRASCVVISEEVALRKPDPAIFALAAERLGVETSRTLFVGDPADIDVIGAAGVGMQTAWLTLGRTWPEDLRTITPTYVIEDLGALIAVVGAG